MYIIIWLSFILFLIGVKCVTWLTTNRNVSWFGHKNSSCKGCNIMSHCLGIKIETKVHVDLIRYKNRFVMVQWYYFSMPTLTNERPACKQLSVNAICSMETNSHNVNKPAKIFMRFNYCYFKWHFDNRKNVIQ